MRMIIVGLILEKQKIHWVQKLTGPVQNLQAMTMISIIPEPSAARRWPQMTGHMPCTDERLQKLSPGINPSRDGHYDDGNLISGNRPVLVAHAVRAWLVVYRDGTH